MSFNFVVDRIVYNKAYPALAVHQAEPYTPAWQEFVQHWPYTVPCELIEHCDTHNFPYRLWLPDDDYPAGSFYPIGVGFFDFTIDYFKLLPKPIFDAVHSGRLELLFYYHEGDSPESIKGRLDEFVWTYAMPRDCYRFISGNTQASNVDNTLYFPDHELLYWRRNTTPATQINSGPRDRDFTALSRTHKWWRATVMTDLYRNRLLDNSYWSYNADISLDEPRHLNPIETDRLNLTYAVDQFLLGAPYTCDDLTADQHNNHALVETEHYANSYCNIVLETYFDIEQTGTFLSEKVFKPIKHGQPFVVAGPPNTLATLRKLGYRTFDHAIDNTYDSEPDPVERWRKLFRAICAIRQTDRQAWFDLCRADVEHNQQLFVASKYDRLNTLCEKLKIKPTRLTFL